MKVITLDYVNCVPFSCSDTFHNSSQSSQQIQKKPYCRISEKHEKTSINLSNVFDFLG